MPDLPSIGALGAPEVVVRHLQQQLDSALHSVHELEEELSVERQRSDSAVRVARQEMQQQISNQRAELDSSFGDFAREIRLIAEQKAFELEHTVTGPPTRLPPLDDEAVGLIDDDSDGTLLVLDASVVDKEAPKAAAHKALEKFLGVENAAAARVSSLSQQLAQAEGKLLDE